MNESPLFNEHWFRIRELTPRIPADVSITRHVYRQKPQYVLHRQSTGAYHRLDASTFEIVDRLDGSTNIQELWEFALEHQGSDAPTQGELILLLSQLHEAELLIVNRRLNPEQLFQRGDRQSKLELRQRLLNPLFLRFRILDPDRLLSRLCPYFGFLFNRTTLVLVTILIIAALLSLAPHWDGFVKDVSELRHLSPSFALLFVLLYPCLKLLHELAHGLVLKRLDGEVHEFGLAVMVLMPIPYVDATAAAAIPDKKMRMLVGSIGILVELTIAAIATFVWIFSDGLIAEGALVLMLIGGLSSLLFNGNPLLKFDGYYVLSDAIEIPNLADRSKHYLRSLASKLVLGNDDPVLTCADRGEKIWLICYGIASSVYRVGLMLFIAFLISGKYFFFGVILSLWILVAMIFKPIFQFGGYLLAESDAHRWKAVTGTSVIVALLVVFLTVIPVPFSTTAEGVVWLPENAIIRMEHGCNITSVDTPPGQQVDIGDLLFTCEDPELPIKIRGLESELAQLEAENYGLNTRDKVKFKIIAGEITSKESELKLVRSIQKNQKVHAKLSGKFVAAGGADLTGQFIKHGDAVAYIIPELVRSLHIVLDQSASGFSQHGVEAISLKFIEKGTEHREYHSDIQRISPKASKIVPSQALTTAGGGKLLADPGGDGFSLMESVFAVELTMPDDAPELLVGGRVWVKFKHQSQPVIQRLAIQVQQTFLRRISA